MSLRFAVVALMSLVLQANLGISSHAQEKALQRAPESGAKAIGFTAKDLNGESFEFQPTKQSDWTVLIFLRGYPGYQCPICTKQVGELVAKADEFVAAKAKVVFVYPGAVKELVTKAQEFTSSTPLPSAFQLVVDSDFRIVNEYKVRWDAPRETAFPSTFIIDPTGFIRFAKVSKTHGDRATAKEILAVIAGESAPTKVDPKRQ